MQSSKYGKREFLFEMKKIWKHKCSKLGVSYIFGMEQIKTPIFQEK